MFNHLPGYITSSIIGLFIVISSIFYIYNPNISRADTDVKITSEDILQIKTHTGKYVLINLGQMSIQLQDGTTTLKTAPLVSIGKPSSYYETIGGSYNNDYKEPEHFSSIGHVFMPWSIHVFGNFFIHGIPYYPDGTKVSSTYSGGCIRLEDADAEAVYNFVEHNTPIIIVKNNEYEFYPTATSTEITKIQDNIEMTRYMVAIISLEVLTQDDVIIDTDGFSTTTRRTVLNRLINGDDSISELYSSAIGEKYFVSYMNKKAKSIGLTNTVFTDVITPVKTTDKDYARFMEYVNGYKSYLQTISTTTRTTSL